MASIYHNFISWYWPCSLPLETLPADVTTHIFNCFSIPEYTRANLVSKKWRELSQHSDLGKCLNYIMTIARSIFPNTGSSYCASVYRAPLDIWKDTYTVCFNKKLLIIAKNEEVKGADFLIDVICKERKLEGDLTFVVRDIQKIEIKVVNQLLDEKEKKIVTFIEDKIIKRLSLKPIGSRRIF